MNKLQPPFDSTVDASIVVVAYNHADLLISTLQSLHQSTHDITYQLIIVDNASTDINWDRVKDVMPAAQLIRNPTNTGFAAANNIGIRHAYGRYVILLNPDTLLIDDTLSALVQWMDYHTQAGMAGPRLLQPNGATQPYSFGYTPTPVYLLRRLWSHLRGSYLHNWRGPQPQRADWVAGTCMIVRRDALAEVGLLDERFFLYFEDVDWGMRFRRAGWDVMFVPSIAITHIGGGSVGQHAVQHYDRSLVRFYRKCYGALAGFGVWLALRLYRRLPQARLLLRRSITI